MSGDSTPSVTTLHTNQRLSSIRLKVLRIGHEILCGSNLSTRVKKLIMMDNEGIQIGAIMFNGDIDNFVHKFEVDKTYLISNGEVRQVDGRYPSIHPKKELILKKYTVVNETSDSIDMKIKYNFVEFKDIESKFNKKEEFDIYGTLVGVEKSKLVPTKTTTASSSKTVRDITIVNKENQFMEICLWEDMAINEGDKLHKILEQNPIIAITNVAAKKFLGNLQLQSTMRSILQISPQSREIEPTVQSSYENYDPLRITESKMIQKIAKTKEVTLKDIKENQHMLSKESYYCFMGIVTEVQNKESIWYDSCKTCATSCPKNAEITICKKCNEEVVETTPRFRITINVIQGDYDANVTMFDEVAAVYVGCSVNDYILSISQGENDSAYYRGLMVQNSKEIRFMTTIKHAKIDDRGKLTLIANAIQKTKCSLVNAGMKSSMPLLPIEEPRRNQGEGEEKLVKKSKTPKVGEKKKPNKKVKQNGLVENKESEAQLNDAKGRKKRRIIKKDFQDYIDIPSDDDDQTLEKFISDTKNKRMKCPPLIKVKQEKM